MNVKNNKSIRYRKQGHRFPDSDWQPNRCCLFRKRMMPTVKIIGLNITKNLHIQYSTSKLSPSNITGWVQCELNPMFTSYVTQSRSLLLSPCYHQQNGQTNNHSIIPFQQFHSPKRPFWPNIWQYQCIALVKSLRSVTKEQIKQTNDCQESSQRLADTRTRPKAKVKSALKHVPSPSFVTSPGLL